MPRKWTGKTYLFPVSGVSSRDLSVEASARAKGGQFRILSAGSLLRVKGFGLAIKGFKAFLDKYPEAEMSIVGSGPEETRLRDLARRAQLGAKMHFLPTMPRDELLSKMAASDVFLFPSLRDGGGTVAIEAMSVGKPVVCLDTGGPGTHISSECGMKIAPRSPHLAVQEIADALERLYLNEELRAKLGQAARERAGSLYHWDRLGERLMEIYERALDDGASNQP